MNVRANPQRDHAERIAQNIRDFWAARGHKVKVWIARAPFGPEGVIYDIKSDLKNGLPTRKNQ